MFYEAYAYGTHAGEMHTHEIVPTYEIYVGEVYAHDIHTCEVHAYYETHACTLMRYPYMRYVPARSMFMRCTPMG